MTAVTAEQLAAALRARADWLDLPRDMEAPRPYITREQFRAAADMLEAAAWLDIATAPPGVLDAHPLRPNGNRSIWTRHAEYGGPIVALILGRLDVETQEWLAEKWRPVSVPGEDG